MRYCSQIAHKLDLMRTKESWLQTEMQVVIIKGVNDLVEHNIHRNWFLQGVPYYWAHFVFVIFSGSRAHTEELFIAIG